MFGILMSAVGATLGFLLRSLLVKFVIFFALFFVTTGFMAYLVNLLPDASSINGALGQIGSGTWYFLDLFGFSYGFPLVVSAWALRFLIRRMPVVG